MNTNSKRRPKKFLALIICLNLFVALAVGGTVAYIFTSSETVTNTFTPVTSGSKIDEKFDKVVKTDVVVTNTGDVDSYIRAKVVITWKNADGEVYPSIPVLDTNENEGDYTISYGSDWTLAADGFWYYNASVPATNPDSATTELIKEAKWIKSCEEEGYSLNIEILSQAIQSTPNEAVDVWDSLVTKDGVTSRVDVDGENGTLTVTSTVESN